MLFQLNLTKGNGESDSLLLMEWDIKSLSLLGCDKFSQHSDLILFFHSFPLIIPIFLFHY